MPPLIAMLRRTSQATVALLRRYAARYDIRWRLRDWRLRTKLIAVLVVPLVLAGVLSTLLVADLVHRSRDYAVLAHQVGFVQQLNLAVYDLQGERHQVATLLASSPAEDRATLRAQVAAQIQRVDTAVTKLRTGDLGVETLGPVASDAYQDALNRLSELAGLRQSSLGPGSTPNSAMIAYSGLLGVLIHLEHKVLDGAILSGVPDAVIHQAAALEHLVAAEEQVSLQQVLLLVGILSGRLSAEQQVVLRTTDFSFDRFATQFGEAASLAQRQRYFATPAALDRQRLLDAALDQAARGAPLQIASGEWDVAAGQTVQPIHQGEVSRLTDLRTEAAVNSDREWNQGIWAGVAVAALLLLAVALLVAVVRSLLRPLRTLRTATFEVADRRLPEVVEQVLNTDVTPDKTKVDPLPVHSKEEVGQVARAIDTVYEQAVRVVAEQAQLRSSLTDVFVHLSGRSQRLLEEQLRLIEKLRGVVQDPELVSSLLQLDRLAARVRRHSESLLALAGGAARRGEAGPVAVLDVLNNAVAEIDAYQRVTVGPSPAAMVSAPVALDLGHLIAELLDNATSATAQGTMVTLGAVLTEDLDEDLNEVQGLLVEITDSGPGIPAAALQAINARLVSAPDTDPSVSGQMGFFVVRELAAAHGITVRLRERLDNRGITATVLLPSSLVTVDLRVPSEATKRLPEQPATTTWSAINGQPPLTVSVLDAEQAADLFSPSSISPPTLGVVSAPSSRPRTAQEEWFELFGRQDPQAQDPQPESQPELGSLSEQPGSSIPPAPAGANEKPEEVRAEIFEMVSAWFRERQSASVSNSPSTIAAEWRSPLDAGWQAAQALRTRVDHELTPAGLPKRQPRAHLVSGADGRVLPTPLPARLARTPDAVRGRLSRYQRGLRVGRHARIGPDDQFTWTDAAQRPVNQRPFEENQQ